MTYVVDGAGEDKHVNYEPSLPGGYREAPQPERDYHQYVEGHLGRYQTTNTRSDYQQAGDRYRSFEDWERDELVDNVGGDLTGCPEVVQLRMVWHLWHCDEEYGRRVAEVAGIDLERAKALPPLPGKPMPHENRQRATSTDGKSEEPATSDEMASAK